MAVLSLASTLCWAGDKDTKVSNFSLEGEIEGENITFTLQFDVDIDTKGTILPLVIGDVAYLEGTFPKYSELVREGDNYALKFRSSREGTVMFRFASRPLKEGDWRRTRFAIPAASIRKVSVLCDRDDLEVKFPSALSVERRTPEAGKTQVTAFLGIGEQFEVGWKPEVRKLESDLVVTCDANTLATASVGAMRLDSVFTYRVIQGELNTLTLQLPDVNVTQVQGEDIQDWRIDRTDPQQPKLLVTLSRPKTDIYRLQVESETLLPEFPAQSTLPVLDPENVLRTSGFLMVGTDSAIKLNVARLAGLTQVDQAAFPAISLDAKQPRAKPTRSIYTYQYANTPYRLELEADDIVTSFTADNRLVLTMSDNELSFDASVEIDVKDAPAREITIETANDPEWTVTSITGQQVSEADTDVRVEQDKRVIYIPFKQAVSGTVLVNVRMEKSLKADAKSFSAPEFAVKNAKSERGYIVVAAEKGVRLVPGDFTGVREVHTGSAPMRVEGAQHAFRFKDPGWTLALTVERAVSATHCETFHLVSLGEGVMYCSVTLNYDIDGSPIQELVLKVPAEIETLEIVGADIEGWRRDGETCTVRLQTKIIGEYTLLVTYDRQFDYEGADISVGGIETIGSESEVGYIGIASSASLKLKATTLPQSIIEIDREEIPAAYSSPVADPIIGAYKYVRTPHTADIHVEPFETEQLLGQVSDCVTYTTTLSRDGESITTASYFIKNASRQYFVLQLPEGVKPWSIRTVNPDGTKEDVLSQQSNGQILIPVRRPRDPSMPIQVEVVYALSLGEMTFWRSAIRGMDLLFPVMPDTHATFVSCSVSVPEDFAIVGGTGDLTAVNGAGLHGFAGIWSKLKMLWYAVKDGPRGNTIWDAVTCDWQGVRQTKFTRTVNLHTTAAPLVQTVRVVPKWLGSVSSIFVLLGGVVLGLVLTLAGSVGRAKPFVIALGLTALIYGVSQSSGGCSLIALGAVLAVLLAVAISLLRLLWRGTRRAGHAAGAARARHREKSETKRRAKQEAKAAAEAAKAEAEAAAAAAKAEEEAAAAEEEQLPEADNLTPFEPDTPEEAEAEQPQAPPPEEPDQEDDQPNPSDPSDPSDPPPDDEPTHNGGSMHLRMLFLTALAAAMFGTATAAVAAKKSATPEPPGPAIPLPVMDSIEITIAAPGTGREEIPSANITLTCTMEVEDPITFPVLPASAVLTSHTLGSSDLAIESDAGGYRLVVKDDDEYTFTLNYQVKVAEENGQWSVAVPLLPNMRNSVKLTIPEAGLDVKADAAVLFRSEEKDEATQAEAVFGSVDQVEFTWSPRVRKTKLEDAVFFCEANSLVGLQSGVVELTNLIRYQIAQGELKELKVKVPEGMSVTAVPTPGIATWSFDPDTRLLDAILEKAVSGDFTLAVTTQVACEGLPYSATIGAIEVVDSQRQRGSIAIAASDTIQVRIGETTGLNAMNIEDFPAAMLQPSNKQAPGKTAQTIRRAFRYHQASEVKVTVETEQVLPEIRVTETGTLSIADERIVLATKLSLAVAKAGVFSASLEIPDDFDVETLTGKDVSHWDESKDQGHGVVVHFTRQVMDTTDLNLVVARVEKGIEERITVPRVGVVDARKHSGRLTVSGERGVRMMVESHQGIDILKASEEGIHQAGVHVFDILRPNWSIVLRTEVMDPLVKPDVLQWVDLAEGMLQCRAYIRYEIENAGVKSFRLQSPMPGITLSVTGRHISRVHEMDKTNGVWQVDLHNKVENQYAMTVTYQVPYDPAEQRVVLKPLRMVDTEGQRGYLVVTCAGRVQVQPAGESKGLKVEDPRSIPTEFGAGDLSSAIQCYRTIRPDYELALSVVRHKSADVLPATINNVRMTSVLAASGDLVTHANLRMTVGSHRFLKVELPGKDDTLWTVLVNGKEVATAREDESYCIPLAGQEGDRDTDVDIVYSGVAAGGFLLSKQVYKAPKFGLPLNDIEWSFYAVPGLFYYGFDGSMQHRDEDEITKSFNTETYLAMNRFQREAYLQKAKQVLDVGEQLQQAGRQREAQKAFQEALNYSQGQADLNEDARVQLRNLLKQQVKIGLVNRRDAVRHSRNKLDAQQLAEMQNFQDGDFSQEYAARVEQRLSAKDNDALEVVADKIIDQQAAAAGVVTAIRITLPEHGRRLNFYREMHIDPAADLTVEFKASDGRILRLAQNAGMAAALFLVLWLTGRLAAGGKPRMAVA